jgi:hypothetical protein
MDHEFFAVPKIVRAPNGKERLNPIHTAKLIDLFEERAQSSYSKLYY